MVQPYQKPINKTLWDRGDVWMNNKKTTARTHTMHPRCPLDLSGEGSTFENGAPFRFPWQRRCKLSVKACCHWLLRAMAVMEALNAMISTFAASCSSFRKAEKSSKNMGRNLLLLRCHVYSSQKKWSLMKGLLTSIIQQGLIIFLGGRVHP